MGMDLKSIGLPQGFIRIINNHPRYFSNVKTNTTLQAVYRINNIMMTSLEQKENYLTIIKPCIILLIRLMLSSS